MKIYHFHNGKGGGVLSVIRNLLLFKQHEEIENHVIYTINKDKIKEYTTPVLEGATSEQIFYYSPNWNFYYTCKQLAKLLPEDGIIVAHDWLELGMVSNLGLPNPVIQFLHGDYPYYYELAKINVDGINKFIAVAESISFKLIESIPERAEDILYLRFPVPVAYEVKDKVNKNNIVFIGRLSKEKGYDLLPQIAKKIQAILPCMTWHIVGAAIETNDLQVVWDENIPVKLYGSISNEKVRELLQDMGFFILPSTAEGMPVSLIEAMKAGVVPLVNKLEGGIAELMINDETGYVIENNSVDAYAEKIGYLESDEQIYKMIRQKCIKKASELFEPYQNTALIETCFLSAAKEINLRKPRKVYGSRLDQPWLPNYIVSGLRKRNGK